MPFSPNWPLNPQHRSLLLSLAPKAVIWGLPEVGFPRPGVRGGSTWHGTAGHVTLCLLGGRQPDAWT